MPKIPYPVDSFEVKGAFALFKHLFCMEKDFMLEDELNAIASLYCPLDNDVLPRILTIFNAKKVGHTISFKEKNNKKRIVLERCDEKIAFINGREDEGNSLLRYKTELDKKGIKFDEFWFDQISIDNQGLVGFPVDRKYKVLILANPEMLESDSAPAFMLKTAIMEELECIYHVFPTRLADIQARSKLECLRFLRDHNVSIPDTLVTSSINQAFQFVKGMHARKKDIVIKPVAKGGGWGVGKIPCGTNEARILDIIGKYKWWYGDGVILVQEFIENLGFDKRVLVLDDLILGVERRTSSVGKDSWIYNINKGAIGTEDSIDSMEMKLVINAAIATNQKFCGVDMIKSQEGTNYILEVNSTPGFKGFEEFLGFNVASFVLDYLLFFT